MYNENTPTSNVNEVLDMCDVEASPIKPKVTACRISPENKSQLDELKLKTGSKSLDKLMKKLINNYTLNEVQVAVPNRSTEIADFEAHAKALISLYAGSIATCENAESRIREEFRTGLEEKANTIQQLSKQLTEKENKIEFLENELQKLRRTEETLILERDSLSARISAMKKAEETDEKLSNLLAMMQTHLNIMISNDMLSNGEDALVEANSTNV
ncbi:MAG: hypothetical protein IKN81_03510 [Oscillospiraceae bacterium]|nr:hypothetical protein [Oscillospiraceae bacterium]